MKSAVILISGRGSNMQALVEAKTGLDVPRRHLEPPRRDGPRVGRVAGPRDARRGPQGAFASRETFDAALGAGGRRVRPGLSLPRGLHAHPHRGVHRPLPAHASSTSIPSLLPSFPGLDTHRRALEAGVKLHGATVHFVTPALDHGPILVQAAVPVLDGRHRGLAGGARAGAGAPHLPAGGAVARAGPRRIPRPGMSSRCGGRALRRTGPSPPGIRHENRRPRSSPACLALPALAIPTQVEAEYDISTGGITIGHVSETYVRKGDTYRIESTTRTEGVLKLFRDETVVLRSEGRFGAGGLQPLRLRAAPQRRPQPRHPRGLRLGRRRCCAPSTSGETTTHALPAGTQDRLSIMYQFMNVAPRGDACACTCPTAARWSSTPTARWTSPGSRRRRASSPPSTTSASRKARRKARAQLWLAKDRFNIPVRVVFEDAKGLRLEQTIVSLTTR